MKRKAFIISIITIIISIFSLSYTFAANNKMNNVTNGIKNAVGGAENMVEGAGSAIGNAVKDGMNTIGNGAKNVGNATQNTIGAMTNNGDRNVYTTTRTTARLSDDVNTAGGMSTQTYTWIIIGITAAAIVILLWSYFRQNKDNNIYIDSNDR